jgi:hypothetical protein
MLGKIIVQGKAGAFSLHLLFSVVIAMLAAALVFVFWFPFPFRKISGGIYLFGILMTVDALIGPMLTWVVFDKRKSARELKWDLSVIVSIQMIALIYGLWSMYQARPVYLIHEVDRFVTVSAADIDPADLKDALPGFRSIPHFGLRTLGLREAKDQDEKLRALEFSLVGKDLSLQPRFWQELSDSNKDSILKRSKPLEELRNRNNEVRSLIDKWLERQTGQVADYRSFPLVSRDNFWTVVLDKDLRMVGYLPIDPF